MTQSDTVYQHLTKILGIPLAQVVIWGRSLGIGPSFISGREGTNWRNNPGNSIYDCLPYGYRNPVLPWDRFPNLKRAPHIHGPSLVIHGHKDEIVPFRHGKKVYNARFPTQAIS